VNYSASAPSIRTTCAALAAWDTIRDASFTGSKIAAGIGKRETGPRKSREYFEQTYRLMEMKFMNFLGLSTIGRMANPSTHIRVKAIVRKTPKIELEPDGPVSCEARYKVTAGKYLDWLVYKTWRGDEPALFSAPIKNEMQTSVEYRYTAEQLDAILKEEYRV
jgi:hypothetical protein